MANTAQFCDPRILLLSALCLVGVGVLAEAYEDDYITSSDASVRCIVLSGRNVYVFTNTEAAVSVTAKNALTVQRALIVAGGGSGGHNGCGAGGGGGWARGGAGGSGTVILSIVTGFAYEDDYVAATDDSFTHVFTADGLAYVFRTVGATVDLQVKKPMTAPSFCGSTRVCRRTRSSS